MTRRKLRRRKKWYYTPEEINQLLYEFNLHTPLSEMAAKLGRSPCGMAEKLKALSGKDSGTWNPERVSEYEREQRRQRRMQHGDEIRGHERRYRARHRDEIRERMRQYRMQHRENFREYYRQYYAQHGDELRKKARQSYRQRSAQHRDELKEYGRQYRAQHRGKIKEYSRRHYQQRKIKEMADLIATPANVGYRIGDIGFDGRLTIPILDDDVEMPDAAEDFVAAANEIIRGLPDARYKPYHKINIAVGYEGRLVVMSASGDSRRAMSYATRFLQAYKTILESCSYSRTS